MVVVAAQFLDITRASTREQNHFDPRALVAQITVERFAAAYLPRLPGIDVRRLAILLVTHFSTTWLASKKGAPLETGRTIHLALTPFAERQA